MDRKRKQPRRTEDFCRYGLTTALRTAFPPVRDDAFADLLRRFDGFKP